MVNGEPFYKPPLPILLSPIGGAAVIKGTSFHQPPKPTSSSSQVKGIATDGEQFYPPIVTAAHSNVVDERPFHVPLVPTASTSREEDTVTYGDTPVSDVPYSNTESTATEVESSLTTLVPVGSSPLVEGILVDDGLFHPPPILTGSNVEGISLDIKPTFSPIVLATFSSHEGDITADLEPSTPSTVSRASSSSPSHQEGSVVTVGGPFYEPHVQIGSSSNVGVVTDEGVFHPPPVLLSTSSLNEGGIVKDEGLSHPLSIPTPTSPNVAGIATDAGLLYPSSVPTGLSSNTENIVTHTEPTIITPKPTSSHFESVISDGGLFRPPPILTMSSSVEVSEPSDVLFTPSNVLDSKIEIFKLLECIIRMKGEVLSKLYAVILDNWNLIEHLTIAIKGRLAMLNAFTLNGIIILRQILEFTNYLVGNWKITVPNADVEFSTLLREPFETSLPY